MDEVNNPADEYLRHIQRDLNCLSDANRQTRKRALEKLTKFFSSIIQDGQKVILCMDARVCIRMCVGYMYECSK